ncbi:hypothetical protein ACFYOF_18200 [Streptomyces sp. NPDC007148]|uniref:hypothetical protein n=1 Tax=Streptomyces sp. NPDC007148 TaxID=3364775 RepID=UPI0036BC6B30
MSWSTSVLRGALSLYINFAEPLDSRPASQTSRHWPKTHVQHVLTALACNVTRVADWIADPIHPRRAPSHFRALCTAPN